MSLPLPVPHGHRREVKPGALRREEVLGTKDVLQVLKSTSRKLSDRKSYL